MNFAPIAEICHMQTKRYTHLIAALWPVDFESSGNYLVWACLEPINQRLEFS